MPREALQPEGMAKPKPPYSPVVVSGETVYTAGQIANDSEGNLIEGGIEEQTRRTLENVRTCLAAAGCTLDDVVSSECWLTDPRDFVIFNAIYKTYFTKSKPIRSVFQNHFMLEFRIEMKVVAYKPQ